jgi:hypothetical protein
MCLAVLAADGDKAAPSPIKADGSLLNEAFDGAGVPDGWDLSPGGGNRKDVSFKDGRCVLNPGQGDNNITMPPLKANLQEDFVIELAFGIPAPTKGGYSILSMTRESGEFQVVVTDDGDARRVVMGKDRVVLGDLRPGKTYTLALQFQPKGECKGVLAGPGIEKPSVQTVAGVEGVIHNIVLGNVFGAAEGSLFIEHAKAGKPAK